ncbi:unnamed protein product [Urochloa humidicola]
MRIRRNAARVLGSASSASAACPPLGAAPPSSDSDLLKTPPPPPHLTPCSARESRGGGSSSSPDPAAGKCCEFSRSCWDVVDELSVSNPQAADELLDKYLVHATSWLFSAIVPAVPAEKKELADDTVQMQPEVVKKAAIMSKGKKNKEGGQVKKNLKIGQAKKNAKIKQEEGEEGAELWNCKKNDGKGWRCPRKVSRPGSLCDYHFVKMRSYCNPDFALTMEEETAKKAPLQAALKPSMGSKKQPRKKKSGNDFSATEGFYYYAGFGFRSERHYRSSVDDSVPTEQEMEEDFIKREEEQELPKDASHPSQVEAEGHADDPTISRIIAGIDEDSSDEYFNGIYVAGSSMDGNGDPQASNGGSSKRKIQRKPVKARSIKSLM